MNFSKKDLIIKPIFIFERMMFNNLSYSLKGFLVCSGAERPIFYSLYDRCVSYDQAKRSFSLNIHVKKNTIIKAIYKTKSKVVMGAEADYIFVIIQRIFYEKGEIVKELTIRARPIESA